MTKRTLTRREKDADARAKVTREVRVADDKKVRETAARIAARDKELLKRLAR